MSDTARSHQPPQDSFLRQGREAEVPTSPATVPKEVPELLAKQFPDLATGAEARERLISGARPHERFAVLAIRPEGDDDTSLSGAASAIASQEDPGAGDRWILSGPREFLMLLPSRDPETAMATATTIAEQGREQGILFTMGIACHPTIDFSADAVFDNAAKALVHAEFFGPDTRTPFDAVSLNISGDREYQNGHLDAAIFEYEKALQINPEDPNVLNSLGVCYGQKEEPEKALALFARSMVADPHEVMPIYNTGLLHQIAEDLSAAALWFEKARALAPDRFEILFRLAKVLMEENRYADARPHIEAALAARPDNGAIHRLSGDLLLSEEEVNGAFAAYKKALKFAPADAAAMSGLGHCFDRKGENPDIAATFCEEALLLQPENPLFAYHLGRIRLRQNRVEEAKALFAKAGPLADGVSIPPGG